MQIQSDFIILLFHQRIVVRSFPYLHITGLQNFNQQVNTIAEETSGPEVEERGISGFFRGFLLLFGKAHLHTDLFISTVS